MDIDAVIAEAVAPAPAPEETQVAEATIETQEGAEEVAPEPEADKPKELTAEEERDKLRKAKSRDDRKIGKLTALKYQYEKELAELRASKVSKTEAAEGEPKEEDFEGKPYGDYLKAVAKYEAKKTFSETQTQEAELRKKFEADSWEQERAEAIDANAVKAKTTFGDFESVMNENAEYLSGIAPHVKQALLEADNGAFALYLMAKEGVLADLNDMSPAKVGIVVGKYEDRALALKKPVTKAPAPLTPAKGVGSAGKSVSNMTAQELLRAVRS
jgi:hypothetical protein